MHQFPKFTPAWNSTCFEQFLLSILRSSFTVPSALVCVILKFHKPVRITSVYTMHSHMIITG